MASRPKMPKVTNDEDEFKNMGSMLRESISRRLDLHTTLPTQVGIKSIRIEEISSINPVQNANFITFQAKSHGDEVIFPEDCYLKLEFKVLKKSTNLPLTDADDVMLVRNPSSAMMKNINVKLCNSVVQSGDGLQAFRSDLEKLLLYTKEGRKNLDLCDYYEEEHGKFDYIDVEFDKPKEENTAPGAVDLIDRRETILNSKTIYCYDLIHANLFMQDRPLPPNSDFEITYDLQDNPDFYFLSKSQVNSQRYKIQLERAHILVTYWQIDLDILHEMFSITINNNWFYHIPMRRIELNYFNKPSNISDVSEPNTVVKEGNILPRRIFVVLVKQSAFQGKITQDPFNYVNLKPINIALRLNGQLTPYPEIKANRNQDPNDLKDPLFYLRKSCGTNFSKYFHLGFNVKNMQTGYFVSGWDLTSGDSEDAYELVQRKTVELAYTLQQTTTEAHVMIILTEFDAEIQVDSNRNVYHTM